MGVVYCLRPVRCGLPDTADVLSVSFSERDEMKRSLSRVETAGFGQSYLNRSTNTVTSWESLNSMHFKN